MGDVIDFIIDWFVRNEVIYVLILLAPFWIRVFINSHLINHRDKTNHFILFLKPFSIAAFVHGLESAFTFYWRLHGEKRAQKKLVNILSLIFLLIVTTSIIFSLLFMQNKY